MVLVGEFTYRSQRPCPTGPELGTVLRWGEYEGRLQAALELGAVGRQHVGNAERRYISLNRYVLTVSFVASLHTFAHVFVHASRCHADCDVFVVVIRLGEGHRENVS